MASNIRRSREQSKCFCYAEAQQYKWHLVPNIRRSRVQSKCFCYAEAQQYKWRDSVKYTKKFAFPGEMLTFAQVKFELFKFSPAMPALDAIYYNF